MKKIAFLLLSATVQLCSLAQSPFIGIWEGKVNVGVELRLVFTIKEHEPGKFTAIMDIPDQGLNEMVSKDVIINNDSIFIHIKQLGGSYAGRKLTDSTIEGQWKLGFNTALKLKKVEKVKLIHRQQTPVPPFPYKAEDIIYTNKDKTIQYGATITMPHGKGPFPAVVLITGSGQQNRDEEIAGHKPFAVIADHLTRNGFLVLRVDDRGVGKTTGEVRTATTLDFSEDVNVGIEYLKGRKEVNKKRLALIGHSEGGMIAQIIASTRNDIAAIVLMAGPGKSGAEVLMEQNTAILSNAGMAKNYVDSYIELYAAIIQHAKPGANDDTLKARVSSAVEDWIEKTPKNIVMATTGIFNDGKKIEFINRFSETLNSPWFRYFLNFQPAQHLEKLRCKVFALNGSKDIQVLSQSNLSAIEAALKKSKTAGYKIKEYEGLNHLFQKCKTCGVNEYGLLEETISVEVLKDITEWLKG